MWLMTLAGGMGNGDGAENRRSVSPEGNEAWGIKKEMAAMAGVMPVLGGVRVLGGRGAWRGVAGRGG